MRGECGKKGYFSPKLPCAVEEVHAEEPDEKLRAELVDVCGQEFAEGSVCCTAPQVEALKANLDQAEPLLLSCPACRNNFRALFCSFTCSADQSRFVDVLERQRTDGGKDGDEAVKRVQYHVGDEYRQGFYDSCKNVKFGASNGFAMDLIGGGAKDADAFLKFLGDERPLVGSPFQIDFPRQHKEQAQLLPCQTLERDEARKNVSTLPPIPFNPPPRACSDESLMSRCACTDCPAVCAVLPPVAPPSRGQDRCTVGHGGLECFSLILIILYILGTVAFFVGYGTSRRRRKRIAIRHRNSGLSIASDGSGYERVRLDTEDDIEGARRGHGVDNSSGSRAADQHLRSAGLIGATGLGHLGSEDDSSASSSMGAGAASGGIDALDATQPRSYALNVLLTRVFYKVGLFCARSPWLTFTVAAIFVGLSNLGWRKFEVETDPVKLWVAPHSESRARKEYFDEHFGPFYRTQQVFMMDKTGLQHAKDGRAKAGGSAEERELAEIRPALSWNRLVWWADFEAAVRDLRTSNGTTLQDVCFAPSGHGGPCVTQSILGYFQDDLDGAGVDETNWAERLDDCAESPAQCLPTFQQPLKPNIILGGIPSVVQEPVQGGGAGGGEIRDREGRGSDARSVVTTWVVLNSLDSTVKERAEEWEVALEQLLFSIAGIGNVPEHPLGARRRALGIELALSTGSSLEQELGSSSNTDVPIVVLSYLLMFLYAALMLGGNTSAGLATELRAARAQDAAAAPSGNSHRSGLASRLLFFLPRRGAPRQRHRLGGKFARRILVESKFMLGLFGIVVVLASVSSAVAIFSAAGVKVTLIIGEVLPFLLLAVGVDNIFLLTSEMDRQNALASTANPYSSASIGRVSDGSFGSASAGGIHLEEDEDEDEDSFDDEGAGLYGGPRGLPHRRAYHLSSAERAARALSRMGPSILLSAATQVSAFLLGAIVPMPAVRNFALYAAGSMAIAAVLQCTVFVAAMALDADRTESSRIDCLPCLKIAVPSSSAQYASLDGVGSAGLGGFSSEGLLGRFIRRYYAPKLIRPTSKRIVLALFAGLAVVGILGMRRLEMGLDQRLALPANSYLRDYFNAVDTYLNVGPPVYFVARKVDPRARTGQQALCGRFTTCAPLSLANTLEGERARPESSFLAEPASSWIDDFMQWMNPVLESCCRRRIKDPNVFCSPRDSDGLCEPCFKDRRPAWNITLDGMPESDEFMRYLRQWLVSPTDEDCPLGGQAAYSSALSLDPPAEGTPGSVTASHFRTYHTPLRSQADFIDALRASERISQDINLRNEQGGVEVFAYSLFYVFFDQYLHLGSIALQVLGGAALSIFGITTLLLGSWRTGWIVVLCVTSALIGVAGTMGFLGIQLNALTLVNLSVCSAICVEFCSHVARAFSRAPGNLPRAHPMAQKERDERAWTALVDVGSSVIRGITGTKLVGISVLALTKSDLLKLYYAKMWAALIVLGATHGLILLPVALSVWGGEGYSDGESEAEIARRLARARENEYLPFAAHDEEEEGEDADANSETSDGAQPARRL
ncbi:hypothetical protein IE81DRAFT_326910 [Ceraceosorus guamensis]|uniref:SSD domain-containing protein n=1 Tax=Ceraceosorus guamensis TaxID=1522189 RepID=A0A316VNC4_9BASI|nr:hypothetical protein IE81DRAFT_326910 [Ceraceosorus guamensis]PWN39066.1 hypothetical protein IE81DRAFT_326910 [Ceraceosorus guamensis]